MFRKPSLMARIAVGKTVGLVFGAIGFFVLPIFAPEVPMQFRIGFLLWFITTGALVGLMGVMTYHPVLHIPMPWWLRGPLIGGFMMLMLWLVAGPQMDTIATGMMGAGSMFSSGPWIVIDGLFIGLIMAALATYFGGEGKATVDR